MHSFELLAWSPMSDPIGTKMEFINGRVLDLTSVQFRLNRMYAGF